VGLYVCGCVCLWVCYHDNSKLLEIACINLDQTRSVSKGSDHLQLVKFWPSCAPGRGSARGENFWLRLITASAQCLRLSKRFLVLWGLIIGKYQHNDMKEQSLSVLTRCIYLTLTNTRLSSSLVLLTSFVQFINSDIGF